MNARTSPWGAALLIATSCGARTELGVGGGDPSEPPAPCEPVEAPRVLDGILRDFQDSHPDFEAGVLGDDRGIVEPRLGDDGTPVYAAGPEGTSTTNGPAAFASWFHDVPGTNRSTPWSVPLEATATTWAFASDEFFPLDDRLFGNEGRLHNFHFTLEAHAEFVYRGGEVLTFGGDDDLFAFVAGQRVVDLGGIHPQQIATVSIDALSLPLGLVRGRRYPIDLFFAERQTSGSTFSLAVAGFRFCEPDENAD